MIDSKMILGITFSGGGARGIIHVGLLQALLDHGIKPRVVSGASMGALIGAFYCAGYEPEFVLHILKTYGEKISFSVKNFFTGFRDLGVLKELIEKYMPQDDFSMFKYPFYISVTNLNTGQNEIVHEGPFHEYLIASSAIPILFKPRIVNGNYYCDGGVTNNFPAKPLVNLCDRIIGVHANYIAHKDDFSTILAMTERIYQVGVFNTVRSKIALCDYYVDPPEARNFATYDFHRADEIWRLGYKEGIKLVQKIEKEE